MLILFGFKINKTENEEKKFSKKTEWMTNVEFLIDKSNSKVWWKPTETLIELKRAEYQRNE